MAKKRVWNSGPPPHVGWWNASEFRDPLAWRWWNGKTWSLVAWAGCLPETAGKSASARQLARWGSGSIMWSTHWPKNARVPRVVPK